MQITKDNVLVFILIHCLFALVDFKVSIAIIIGKPNPNAVNFCVDIYQWPNPFEVPL